MELKLRWITHHLELEPGACGAGTLERVGLLALMKVKEDTKVALISLGNIAHWPCRSLGSSLLEPVEPCRPTKYNVSAPYFSGDALYFSG